MSEWISVKERPPQEWVRVIVLTSKGSVLDACPARSWGGGFTTAEKSSDGGRAVHGVTHWMPLPEPPK